MNVWVTIDIRPFDVAVLVTAIAINFFTGNNPAWMLGVIAGVLAGRTSTKVTS